jgi:putative hydrolase of the HAD superfamily
LRLAGAAIAFVDDSPRNVEAARERGWRAEIWRAGATLTDLIPAQATPNGDRSTSGGTPRAPRH